MKETLRAIVVAALILLILGLCALLKHQFDLLKHQFDRQNKALRDIDRLHKEIDAELQKQAKLREQIRKLQEAK